MEWNGQPPAVLVHGILGLRGVMVAARFLVGRGLRLGSVIAAGLAAVAEAPSLSHANPTVGPPAAIATSASWFFVSILLSGCNIVNIGCKDTLGSGTGQTKRARLWLFWLSASWRRPAGAGITPAGRPPLLSSEAAGPDGVCRAAFGPGGGAEPAP